MRTYSNAKYASTNYTHNASATTARAQMVGIRKSQQAKNFWETSIRQPLSLKSLTFQESPLHQLGLTQRQLQSIRNSSST